MGLPESRAMRFECEARVVFWVHKSTHDFCCMMDYEQPNLQPANRHSRQVRVCMRDVSREQGAELVAAPVRVTI